MQQSDTQAAPGGAFRSVAIAALLISLGNIASRLLGFVREPTIAYYFGLGVEAEAFRLAWTVPNTVYDMLISGAVAAALVPVFSELAEGERDEFWRVVSSVLTIALAALAALTALAIWQAPLIVALIAQPEQAELRAVTASLVRLLMPAVLLMGLSGLITAVLQAQRRFLLPAFTMAAFNAGMIAGLVLLHGRLGVSSLAAGAFVGGLAQVALQLPGLRGARLRPSLRLDHPAVRRILRLYAPVALGIGFSIVGTLIDRRLASGYPAALATMGYATTLVQFPLGLVATAVSLAVLPTLSRQSVNDEGAFRATLAMGIKVVLLLILPAAAGLAALAFPIIEAIYVRGRFGAADVTPTALALLLYLPGLPAAAIDQLLIFAFYARKNTLTPNLIQGAAILCYLASALALIALAPQLGFLALVIGNSAQWVGHALIAYWLLARAVPLGGQRLGEAALKGLLASALMAAAAYGAAALADGLPAFAQVGLAGLAGAAVYLGLCLALRVEALGFFVAAVRARLRR